jgi:hypothetical protein
MRTCAASLDKRRFKSEVAENAAGEEAAEDEAQKARRFKVGGVAEGWVRPGDDRLVDAEVPHIPRISDARSPLDWTA